MMGLMSLREGVRKRRCERSTRFLDVRVEVGKGLKVGKR